MTIMMIMMIMIQNMIIVFKSIFLEYFSVAFYQLHFFGVNYTKYGHPVGCIHGFQVQVSLERNLSTLHFTPAMSLEERWKADVFLGTS